MDFLTVGERALMQQDGTDLLANIRLAPPITYRSFVSRVFTPSTGATTATYDDTVLGAIKSDLSAREVAASGGLYQQGDLNFVILRAALAPAPGKEDKLLVDGAEYDVRSWASDPINLLWRLIARRSA
jgi:hypothetical protein